MATEDYDEAAERVKRQAAEQKQAFEEQHDALLDAAAADEELTVEETDTAHIGDATLTVKTDIPGKVIRKLDDIHDADAPPGQMLDVYVDVLTAQTLSVEANGYTWADTEDIRQFYQSFIDEHDAESAAVLCLERVVEEPVGLEQRRRGDAIQSFPEQETGGGRGRTGRGGPRP